MIAPNGYRVRLEAKEPQSFKAEIARSYFAAFVKVFGVGVADNFVKTATLSDLAEASARFADG